MVYNISVGCLVGERYIVEHKDDGDWVKQRMLMEIGGIRLCGTVDAHERSDVIVSGMI